jgi:hypothetical protein
VEAEIRRYLQEVFEKDGYLELDGQGAVLRAVEFTPEFAKALEDKATAIQIVERKRYEVEQAREEARAIEIKNQALQRSKSYLQLRYIEMLERKDFKVVVVPQGDNGFILDIGDAVGGAERKETPPAPAK